MENTKILEILRTKGATGLYHANSVLTSCTFLENGGLLSRHAVEIGGLRQTPQYSDSTDKHFGVYNHLFLDAVDIHHRIRNRNKYGPVLFVFDMDKLFRDTQLPAVQIFKKNPTKWTDEDVSSDRLYLSEDAFASDYRLGTFDTMFTFSLQGGKLPLKPYITEVTLDDPNMQDDKGSDVFNRSLEALQKASHQGSMKGLTVTKRDCRDGCKCHVTYRAPGAKWRDYFIP